MKNLFIDKKWLTAILVVLVLAFMFILAFASSHGVFGDPGDSGTVDEVAHIPSGYAYDKYFDFRLNPEHPPLAKALAGLPLALNNSLNGLKDDWSWNGLNQWDAGWHFIYEAGNDPATIFTWSRLPMMLLMIGLGLFLFKWTRELFGRKVAILTLVLFAFYPDIIAHGRLVTTDIAAAFGYLVAIYYFDKSLTERSWKYTIFAGLAFGLAQLLKFSAFLLYGIFLILIIVHAAVQKNSAGFWKNFWANFKIYFWLSVISLIFVWIIYIPFVWNTPADIEHKVIEMNLTSDPKTLGLRNLLHYLEDNVVLRALGHYLLGVMLVFARVAGGNATFALGHLSDKSISWYFPFAWLVKTPLTIIVLYLFSVILAIKTAIKKEKIWLLFLIFTPIIIYWAFTLKGSLNIGIRHLIPTIPFVLLAIAFWLNRIINIKKIKWQYYGVILLIIFQIISTLSYYPSYIAYFNELVPRGERYKYLTDSSLDWGQDLLRLKKYIDDNNIKNIKIDYFGGSVPAYYIPSGAKWHSSYGPATGWLAVSATYYQSSKLYGPIEGKWSYDWLDDYQPKAEIGGSILVFYITPEDIAENPPASPYPITTMEYPSVE